jgi:hypothetical protein
MSYVWEVELGCLLGMPTDKVIHVLKKIIPNEWHPNELKVGGAYVVKRGERKWHAFFPSYLANNDKTFRSLKAAKAYALAIVTLSN